MPIVQPCTHPGCRTLTMGERCVEHEETPLPIERAPWAPPAEPDALFVFGASFVLEAQPSG